jgi:hypothetical protein
MPSSKKKYCLEELSIMTCDALKVICKAQNIKCAKKLKNQLIDNILEMQGIA